METKKTKETPKKKLSNNYQSNVLSLVSAPARYGKSILVGCWLKE